MKRIIFVHLTPFPAYSGGIDNWLFHMIAQLEERGIACTIIAPRPEGGAFYDVSAFTSLELVPTSPTAPYQPLYRALTRIWRPLGAVSVAATYARWAVSAARALHRVHRRGDRVIALHVLPTMIPLWLLQTLGGRIAPVCYLRGRIGADLADAGYTGLARVYTAIERRAVRSATAVLANGEDTARYAAVTLGVHAVPVPNGVAFTRFAEAAAVSGNSVLDRLRALRDRGAAVVVTVGTLRDVKGIRHVIEAAGELHRIDRDRDVMFVFVGKGDPTSYESLAAREEVSERVIFAGEQSDVPAFLHEADIALAVSGGGGTSNAAIEQMAAGLPIVAWDSLTYTQLLTHGETGHLVRERDPRALADGIRTLLRDPAYRRKLGAAAREAARRYDWSSIADQFLGALG